MDPTTIWVILLVLAATAGAFVRHMWGRHQQSCCDFQSHSSSADPPQSQQPRRQRRRWIRVRTPSGATGRRNRRNRRGRRNRRTSGRDSGGNTVPVGTTSNISPSKRSWRPSWQQAVAGLVIILLLAGNIYQAGDNNTPSNAVDTDSPHAAAANEGDIVQASGSSDSEVVEECASQVHFYATDTQNGYHGPPIEAENHQGVIHAFDERSCIDPLFLVENGSRLGTIEVANSAAAKVDMATRFIENRELWRKEQQEFIDFLWQQEAAGNIELGIEEGRYRTSLMRVPDNGGVPWVHEVVKTSGSRVVMRVGDKAFQLICGGQFREELAPLPSPARQPAPTQPAPEPDHRDESPARQVDREPPSEEEPERDQPPADDSEEEEPSGDAPKIRVCDTRNGELVIVQIEHAREFPHFKQEDHSACAEDDEPADDGDEVADKPCDEDGTCGTPNEHADQQPVGDNADEHEDSTEGYEDPNREDTAEPGPAEENAAEQDEAAEAVDSGDADDLDQTESGLESDDGTPGDSDESATAPSEQADEEQQEGAGGDNPQGDGTEPPSGTDNDTSNDAGSEGSQTDNSEETEDTGDPGAEMELPETSTASAG